MNIFSLVIIIVGFLAVGTYRSSMVRAEREFDNIEAYNTLFFTIWSFICGVLIPLIVLFNEVKWYLAILYFVLGVIFIVNVIPNIIINLQRKNSGLIPLALNITTTLLFLYYIFSSGYSNGENCATVEYYNPDTEKHSTYTLKVNVKDNRVTDIYWDNGGKLNEKHYKEYAYLDDGIASFIDDRGREFIVYLKDMEWCE
ncbi:hypothetical protein MKD41_09755 [Lutibacter sp. A64]|uniref:hypothetical protein n=1 Tax=Lutibacter sp. A64 TaxID=2918526 RepID=UPI001F051866|nr:hypothetical protein [Lutibacter sp. A64]UMB52621.1 hypothetical protein MKD41_09755 [Lutibacter sp. A64]